MVCEGAHRANTSHCYSFRTQKGTGPNAGYKIVAIKRIEVITEEYYYY